MLSLRYATETQVFFMCLYVGQFQIFLFQTVCVFSQKEDIKHIQQDFFLLPLSYPRGGTWLRWGCPGSQLFFEYGHVAYQIDWDDK